MPRVVLVAKMFSSLRLFYVAKSMRKNQTNCKIPWRQNKNLTDVTLIVQLLEVLSAMEMVTHGVKGPEAMLFSSEEPGNRDSPPHSCAKSTNLPVVSLMSGCLPSSQHRITSSITIAFIIITDHTGSLTTA